MWAEATGVPADGVNMIGLPFLAQGLPPEEVQEDWLLVLVQLIPGGSVTRAEPAVPFLTPDKQFMLIDFDQSGGDPCNVIVQNKHSLVI